MLVLLLALVLPLAGHLPARLAAQAVPAALAPGAAPDPWIEASSTSIREVILDVSVPGIELEQVTVDDNVFQRVILPHTGRTAEVGRPELPTFARFVAVPLGARVDVEVVESRAETYPDVLVYPAQPPLPDQPLPAVEGEPVIGRGTQGEEFLFDAGFYARDVSYPVAPIVAQETGRLRDVPYVLVQFYPVQYNPATRTLTLHTYLRVRIRFEGGTGLFTGGAPRAENFERMYRRLFLNYDAIEAPPPRPEGFVTDATGADYLIITAPDFERPARDLAEWKTRRGLLTVVATTDETGSSLTEIDAYIQNAYDTWSPRPAYVLFLGDAEQIPVHYVTMHSYHSTHTGTDLYYFTTAGDDYMPDMAGARIPASTEEEARRIVDSILQYEQDPPADSSFYSNFQVAAYFQDDNNDGTADRLFTQTSEEIRDYLVNNQSKTTTRCYTTNSTSPQYYYDGSPVPADVRAALLAHSDRTCVTNNMNQGRFILNHRDHGISYGWGDPEYLSRDVRGLGYADPEELPVVFSINCETAWFDSETDEEGCDYVGSSSFSEEFLVQNKAIAVFGATRVSYSWYNDALVKGYYDAIWSGMLPSFGSGSPFRDDLYRLGDALGWGKAYLLTQYPPPNSTTLTTMEIHHLLGDATLEIWTDVPQSMVVSHPTSVGAGATSLDVTVDVADAWIVIVQNGAIVGQIASSVAGSNAVALSPAAADGPLYVTVTKHNYRPYQGTVDAGATHILSGCVRDDGVGVENVWIVLGAGVPPARTDATGCYSLKVGDGTYSVAASSERWVTVPAAQEVTVAGADVGSVDFGAEPQRARPGDSYSFESGRLDAAWTVAGDGFGRADTMDCPANGSYALILDQTDYGQFATAGAILSADLACRTDAVLTFWWRDNADEDHAQDAVLIRRNRSDSWCSIWNFTGSQVAYVQQSINLNTAAQACWGSSALTSDFQILFQQYDNYRWPGSDGIAIDDVSISASGQTYTWLGTSSSSWSDPLNWDTGCVPAFIDDVVIPAGAPNWPSVDVPAYAHDVLIQDGAHLDAPADVPLSVYGNWSEAGTGTSVATAGTTVFRGSAPQTVSCSAGSHFAGLQVGHDTTGSTLTVQSNLDVDGDLTILPGATLSAGAYNLLVAGDWSDQGTFSPGTSSVVLDGEAQVASKVATPTTVYYLGPEGFESTFPPAGWATTESGASGGPYWRWGQTGTAGSHGSPRSGTYFAWHNDDNLPSSAVSWLRTPEIALPAGSSPELSFWQRDYYDTYYRYHGVWICTGSCSSPPTNYVEVWSGDTGNSWVEQTIDLSTYAGQNVYLAFRYEGDDMDEWYLDDVSISATSSGASDLTFYDLQVTGGGTKALDSNLSVDRNLIVGNGTVLDAGTHDITAVGGTLTNDGGLRQTKDVPDVATTSFLGVGTTYYGVDLVPTSGSMGETTVTVYGNQTCSGFDTAVQRCFEIEPGTDRMADITFYYRDAEENGQDASNVYHWNGSAWDLQTLDTRDRSGVENNWVRVTGVGAYSPFALANNAPTAVSLSYFEAVAAAGAIRLEWETASDLHNLGFNLYRRVAPGGERLLVNDELIPAQAPGSPGSALYRWLDAGVTPGTGYIYTLESVDLNGRASVAAEASAVARFVHYLPLVVRR
ncbi:MAG: choice-of-anchor J domain-containing protein [Anaerolineae bacterium]|nr:choice-of-anchor J domain-containing protein [Anaerolineae bacterium]